MHMVLGLVTQDEVFLSGLSGIEQEMFFVLYVLIFKFLEEVSYTRYT